MNTNGQWNIITDIDHFYQTLKLIRNNLTGWINDLQMEEDPPANFLTIQVTACMTDNDDDESSDGEQSYLSTSALS
jgi:hypothetical protein